jgi:hypothetical protein
MYFTQLVYTYIHVYAYVSMIGSYSRLYFINRSPRNYLVFKIETLCKIYKDDAEDLIYTNRGGVVYMRLRFEGWIGSQSL